MAAGYTATIAVVDLGKQSAQTLSRQFAPEEAALGGRCLAYRLLLELLTGEEKALSEENPIVIATGPLTFTGAAAASRYDITTLSPVTGGPVSSNFGGDFGLWLKRAGFDALVLKGRCPVPGWLQIRDGEFIFHEAGALWGTDTRQCRQQLEGEKQGCLCIGPAGENAVLFASVTEHDHTSGRTGMGTVFGWKQLKAVTVTGTGAPKLHRPGKFARLNRKYARRLGTHPLTGAQNREGTPSAKPCRGCPAVCRRQFLKGRAETDLPDRLGMDAAAAAGAVAWAREAVKQGLWEGPLPATPQLYEQIAYARGMGARLGMGQAYLEQTYGLTLPKEKKRESHSHAGAYAAFMKAWGLDRETLDLQSQRVSAMLYLDLCEGLSAAGLCLFTANVCAPADTGFVDRLCRAMAARRAPAFFRRAVGRPNRLWLPRSLFRQTRLLKAATGQRLTPWQLLGAGAQCFALEQQLRLRFGQDGRKLPGLPVFRDACTPEEYFALRGWSAEGVPPEN